MPLQTPSVQSVSDVYDLASLIGKEFEALIDRHGPESLSGLMPKVILALENLELLASQAEARADELAELKQKIDRLEIERAARLTDRGRFEQEMEQADQEWQRLREENRRLKQALDEASSKSARQTVNSTSGTVSQLSTPSASPTSTPVAHRQQQQQHLLIVARLKAALSAQRDEARALRRELANSKADCEALQAQSDRLASLNAELMKRIGKLDSGEFDAPANQSDEDSSCSSHGQPEQRRGDAHSVVSSPLSQLSLTPPRQGQQQDSPASASAGLDPNRPRFTLAELRAVLAERNELKARLLEAEEELADAYRQCGRPVSSFEEDPSSDSAGLFGFEIVPASSSFNNNATACSASAAPLLGNEGGGGLSASASSTVMSPNRRASADVNSGGGDGRRSSSSEKGKSNASTRSNSSDLGIKYFVLRLICLLRRRLKRRRNCF